MSLLEWLGESRNPGPVGDVHLTPPPPEGGPPARIVVRALVALALLAAVTWYAIDDALEVGGTPLAPALLVAYLALSAFVSPEPDADNIGYARGLVDDPFRWSDDANRTLLFLAVALAPGRFVIGALLDAVRLARGRRTIVLPPRDRDGR